jgi:hypothetical protein
MARIPVGYGTPDASAGCIDGTRNDPKDIAQ